MKKPASLHYRLIIAVVLTSAFGVLFLHHRIPLISYESDAIGYMARADSAWFTVHPFHGPAYSWAIKCLTLLGIETFSGGKIISVLSTLVFLVISWRLLRQKPYSEMMLLLLIINPVLLTHSVLVLSDMMATALFLTTIFLLTEYSESKAALVFAGIIAGLTYLTRSFYLFVLVLPLLNLMFNNKAGQGKRFLLFYSGFLLTVLPWSIFLYIEKGSPFWNLNYLNILFKLEGLNQGWREFTYFDEKASLSVLVAQPWLFLKSWLRTLFDLPKHLFNLYPHTGVLAAFGFWVWIADMNRLKWFYFVSAMMYAFLIALVWITDRFILIYLPFMAALICETLIRIPPHIQTPLALKTTAARLSSAIPVRKGVIVLVFTITLLMSFKKVPAFFSNEPVEFKQAAEWIQTKSNQPGLIMSAKPHIPYFARAPYKSFRSSHLHTLSMQEFIDLLNTLQPDYFIYDERYSLQAYPNLKKLLMPEENNVPDLLVPVHVEHLPKKLVIYRLKTD